MRSMGSRSARSQSAVEGLHINTDDMSARGRFRAGPTSLSTSRPSASEIASLFDRGLLVTCPESPVADC
jgi:hypothetical protein